MIKVIFTNESFILFQVIIKTSYIRYNVRAALIRHHLAQVGQQNRICNFARFCRIVLKVTFQFLINLQGLHRLKSYNVYLVLINDCPCEITINISTYKSQILPFRKPNPSNIVRRVIHRYRQDTSCQSLQ